MYSKNVTRDKDRKVAEARHPVYASHFPFLVAVLCVQPWLVGGGWWVVGRVGQRVANKWEHVLGAQPLACHSECGGIAKCTLLIMCV